MGLKERIARLESIEVKVRTPDTPEPATYKVPRENLREVIKGLVDCGAVRITEDGMPTDLLWAELDGGLSQIVERMSTTSQMGKETQC